MASPPDHFGDLPTSLPSESRMVGLPIIEIPLAISQANPMNTWPGPSNGGLSAFNLRRTFLFRMPFDGEFEFPVPAETPVITRIVPGSSLHQVLFPDDIDRPATRRFQYAKEAGIVSSASVPESSLLTTVSLPLASLARSCIPGKP
jgi:hypothetical protein